MKHKQKVNEMIEKAKINKNGYAREWLKSISSKKYICIFGAGSYGDIWYEYLESMNIKVNFFCDNNESKWETNLNNNCICISPDTLKKFEEETSVIIAARNFMPIKEQLQAMQINHIYIAPVNLFYFKANLQYVGNKNKCIDLKKNMELLLEICADEKSKETCIQTLQHWLGDVNKKSDCIENQYFLPDIMKFTKNEIFIDAGAYDGDTIEAFLEAVDYQFDAIYGFELDKDIYDLLDKKVCKLNGKYNNKIYTYNIGIWNDESTFKYSSNNTTSQINGSGTEEIKVARIDKILAGKRITFFKMDIEGAEIKALWGAKDIIKANNPKLAICVYHIPEHLWEVPMLIKKFVPEYNIFLRHHTEESTETVCYAVLPKE